MKHFVTYCLAGLFIFLASCTDESIEPDISNFGYEYYPLEYEHWVSYYITEITIDAPLKIYDTIHYFLKEQVLEKIDSSSRDTTYKIHRYYRYTDTLTWTIKDVWSLTQSADKLIKTEENRGFQKFAYPLQLNKEWDGNAINELGEEMYTVSSIHARETINGIVFDSVASIDHKDQASLYEKQYSYEKYAKNIGLVYSYTMDIESQGVIEISKPIETRITNGTIYIQEVVDYKK